MAQNKLALGKQCYLHRKNGQLQIVLVLYERIGSEVLFLLHNEEMISLGATLAQRRQTQSKYDYLRLQTLSIIRG